MNHSELTEVHDKYNRCEECKALIPQNIKICLGCRIRKTFKGETEVTDNGEHKVPKV